MQVRYTYLIDKLTQNHFPVLLVGPTGTGKSVYMKDYLMTKLDRTAWTYMSFGFSAQTSVNMTQVCTFPLPDSSVHVPGLRSSMDGGGTSAHMSVATESRIHALPTVATPINTLSGTSRFH